ncbi:helix-turn-helix domain-containing protein, partial [Candidatus Micrarchaeota archaeon]|nr:helix-turn-helix domain-containing protein [Candidatus Micrarchaeota archaeon]
MPEVWDAKEVAKYLRISEQLVYKAARAGDIPCFKVGGRILFN